MPMTSYSLWLDFQADNNTAQNGFIRPESDFIRILNTISIKLWNKWTDKAEKSQEEKDKLFPFLKGKNIAVNSTAGYYGTFKKPVDYGRLASVRIIVHENKNTIPAKDIEDGKCDGFKSQEEINDEYYDNIIERRCVQIDNQRWAAFVEHLTKGPTLENPGITQLNDQFKVAPRKISVVALDYYVEPTPATFKYKVVPGNPQTGSGDQLIYDISSVPLQWPEQMRKEFLEELKSYFIQYTRDGNYNNINLSQKQVEKQP